MAELPATVVQIEKARNGGFVVWREGRALKAGSLRECLDFISAEFDPPQCKPLDAQAIQELIRKPGKVEWSA
jgi:hypothetical protein